MPPAQFWKLHPVEFWWQVDARRPKKMYGSLTENEVADLYEEMNAMEEWHDGS
jgi:hypothetical protein